MFTTKEEVIYVASGEGPLAMSYRIAHNKYFKKKEITSSLLQSSLHPRVKTLRIAFW